VENATLQSIYHKAEAFLLSVSPISSTELQEYFNIKMQFSTINDIAFRLFYSLQNNTMMPNVIKFWQRQDEMKKILFDYDVIQITTNYKELDALYEKFKAVFPVKNADSKFNLWLKYAKGILDGSKFLCSFTSAQEFDNYIKSRTKTEEDTIQIIWDIKNQIHGFGFALVCDFLKELGYTRFPKPDVHLKNIFVALNLCENDDIAVFKAIINMADAVNETPYKVDKIFWLIASGGYYLHAQKIRGNKDSFIKFIQDNL
jgi:hypothetical protein